MSIAEFLIILAVCGLLTVKFRILWWIFSKRPFPWKNYLLGLGSLLALALIAALFGR